MGHDPLFPISSDSTVCQEVQKHSDIVAVQNMSVVK